MSSTSRRRRAHAGDAPASDRSSFRRSQSTAGTSTTSSRQPGSAAVPSSTSDSEALSIVAVGHSLGGTSLLLYGLLCGALGVSHGVSRLVLLSPAGFHRDMPAVIRWITNTAAFVLKPAGCV